MPSAQDDGDRFPRRDRRRLGRLAVAQPRARDRRVADTWRSHRAPGAELRGGGLRGAALRLDRQRGGKGDAERSELWFSPRRAGARGRGRQAAHRAPRARGPAGGGRPRGRSSRRGRTGRGRCSTRSRTSSCRTTWPPRWPPPGRARTLGRVPAVGAARILEWIVQARRAATRAKRVDETARCAARGRARQPVAAEGGLLALGLPGAREASWGSRRSPVRGPARSLRGARPGAAGA